MTYKNQILSCVLFSGMEASSIEEMLSTENTQVITCGADEFLDSSFLYIILKGSIVIEKQASDGRFVTMGTAEAGAAVNVASVFLKAVPMSRLYTKTGCILLRMTDEVIKTALYKGGIFAVNMAELLSGKIFFLNKKITSLAGYSATSRLHLYLEENNVGGRVEIPMSMTDFADYLGVGRASLYRTLDQLQNDGSIERTGRTIIIKDMNLY